MAFTNDQLERYSRHIILKEVGAKGQKKLLNAKVLIIGAGGLGAPAALYLAAAGVGTIGIVDADEVDLSNLQRQVIHTTADIGKAKVQSAKETKPMLESDLEKALVVQIEKFLLELGRGFMFVGTQQRITLNNTHYYVDMVFYNKILRAYVLIELKTTKLTPEAAGQLNMYLNYYAAEVNDEHDNPPIGIILCTDKDSIAAEYALGGLSNNIFASRYVSYIPNKEQLIAQVEAVLNQWHKPEKE